MVVQSLHFRQVATQDQGAVGYTTPLRRASEEAPSYIDSKQHKDRLTSRIRQVPDCLGGLEDLCKVMLFWSWDIPEGSEKVSIAVVHEQAKRRW